MANPKKKNGKTQAAKKAKPTTLGREDPDKLFRQTRDQLLRQWYKQAQNGDEGVKKIAQARLQLQVWLRDARRQTDRCDAINTEGDTDKAEDNLKRARRSHHAMTNVITMLEEGIPPATMSKACLQWERSGRPLRAVLAESHLDWAVDFRVSRYKTLNLAEDAAKPRKVPLHLETEIVEFEDERLEPELESEQITDQIQEPSSSDNKMPGLNSLKLFEPEDKVEQVKSESEQQIGQLVEPLSDPASIWAQHKLHMQRRYRFTQLPDFALETKLAFQKGRFDVHVDRARRLRKAYDKTSDLVMDPQNCVPAREGIETNWDAKFRKKINSEDSIWDLTSPMLWRHFEDGLSWDYPQWVPRGIMRVQTTSNKTSFYFEFGTHSFSIERVVLQAAVSTQPKAFTATCHQTGDKHKVKINFLVQGFVMVQFPIIAIINSDLGCMHLPSGTVGLTGVYTKPLYQSSCIW